MIPRSYILEWSKVAPWPQLYQIEQDLIITRALVDIYKNPILRKTVAFRGGTALNKLIFNAPTRYSEDIDLVQINAEPIGKTLELIQEALSWLGKPKK